MNDPFCSLNPRGLCYLRSFFSCCFIFFLIFPYLLFSLTQEDLNAAVNKGIKADLRHPVFSNGVLSTECGGVITGPGLRIQAQKIIYTKKTVEGKSIFTIEAEEDVMLEFNDFIFVGRRLEYDFETNTGFIYEGRTSVEPWYFGGEVIQLCASGNYIIYNGFATTSPTLKTDWKITAEEATLIENHLLDAKGVKFIFINTPLMWLPRFKTDLDAIFDSPFHYTVQWGGRQRTRFGISYEIFSWNRLKTFLRVDYRIQRGLGAGIETAYRSEDHRETLETISYIARDSSIDEPAERTRYRFQGMYHNLVFEDKVTIDLSYDLLRDKDMATDYDDRGLELDTAGRTQLVVRRQENEWIVNMLTRVRANNFQTIKQELPTIEGSLRPIELGNTGIITENRFKTSYLDFEYAEHLHHVHDYSSLRLELAHKLYRPFTLGIFNATPEIGGVGIYYGNSPHQGEERLLALGLVGCEVNTHLFRTYPWCRHVIKPYARYEYLTFPTTSPKDHYIFDIEDGWFRLNTMRFGVLQNIYFKSGEGCISRFLSAEVYANAFFDTETTHSTLPKVYSNLIWNATPSLRYILESAWDFQHDELDHINVRTEWTINENFAIASEYRHRDSYDFRKVDRNNFILDSYRSINELRHSQLSDRRDTLLVHFFYRMNTTWAFEFQSRQGWNRRHEPKYSEHELDVIASLRSGLNIKFAFQHKENEGRHDRIAIYFSVGLKRPDVENCQKLTPCLDF